MRVIRKQKNSKMCFVCGLDNPYGLQAPFYDMEDGSVMTLFSYREQHQSYPGRVHGGLITAMLDELGFRALWSYENSDEQFGVTMSLDTKYRKPVPYGETLIGKGIIIKNHLNYFTTHAQIMDSAGIILAEGNVNYIRLDKDKIVKGVQIHEEMPYLLPDDVTEIRL